VRTPYCADSTLHHRLPAVVRHRSFVASLRRRRRSGRHDTVTRRLRITPKGSSRIETWLALRLDVQPGVVHRNAMLTRQTLLERHSQAVHARMQVHTLAHVRTERVVVRTRVEPTPIARQAEVAMQAVVVLAAHRGRAPAALPRLELTTLRAQPAPPPRGGAPEGPGRPPPLPAQPSVRTPAAPPVVLPADELSRVTEHVLRTLDRRVLSHRERTGQLWD
jgi:hypothetical protein